MALSSSGLGSGMDIDSLVSKLMNIETRPLLKLQQKQQVFESKISAVGQVKSGLASFQAALTSASPRSATSTSCRAKNFSTCSG